MIEIGIYRIRLVIDNRIYIGSTGNKRGFKRRWGDHLGELRKGKHFNEYLQRAWDKYGKGNFVFEIVEILDNNSTNKFILEREQYWMDFYKSYERERGFNISIAAGNSMRGRSHSSYSKKKISNTKKNNPRKWTQEQRNEVSKRMKGRKLTEEHTNKIKNSREMRKKRKIIERMEIKVENDFIKEYKIFLKEQREILIRERNGNHSEESRKKISESNRRYNEIHPERYLGENNPFYGKRHTEVSKKKISEKFKTNPCYGRKRSQEEIDKSAAKAKETWRLKKEQGRMPILSDKQLEALKLGRTKKKD